MAARKAHAVSQQLLVSVPCTDAEDALLGGSSSNRSSMVNVHPSDSPLFGLNVISERPRWFECDRAGSQSLRREWRAIATRELSRALKMFKWMSPRTP
jgi:hypothetical protein